MARRVALLFCAAALEAAPPAPASCVCSDAGRSWDYDRPDAARADYGAVCASWDSRDELPWCDVASVAACGLARTFQSTAGHYWAHLPCEGLPKGHPPPPLPPTVAAAAGGAEVGAAPAESAGGDADANDANNTHHLSPTAQADLPARGAAAAPDPLPAGLRSLLAAASDAQDRVILAMTNFGEVDLALNMACSLRAQGLLPQLVVIATDRKTEVALREKGVKVFFDASIGAYFESFHAGAVDKAAAFHSQSWKLLAVQKLKKIAAAVHAGFNVFFTDVDVVFQRSPMEVLQCGPAKPQMLFMWDGPSPTDKGLFPSSPGGRTFPYEANGGFIWACAGTAPTAMLEDAAASFVQFFGTGKCTGAWWCHDQYFVNQALRRAAAAGSLRFGLFDKALFVNGWVMKTLDGNMAGQGFAHAVRDVRRVDHLKAIAVHANFCNSKADKLFVFVKADRSWATSRKTMLWKCAECDLMRNVVGYGKAQSPFFTDGPDGGSCVSPDQDFYDHCCCAGAADGLCH